MERSEITTMPFLTVRCDPADVEQVKAFGQEFGATHVGDRKCGPVFQLDRTMTFIREAHSAGLTLVEVSTENPVR